MHVCASIRMWMYRFVEVPTLVFHVAIRRRLFHPNISAKGGICLDILNDLTLWSPAIGDRAAESTPVPDSIPDLLFFLFGPSCGIFRTGIASDCMASFGLEAAAVRVLRVQKCLHPCLLAHTAKENKQWGESAAHLLV